MSSKELECVKDVMLSNMKTQDIWFDISDGFVETLKEKDKEIERLNNIINKGIEAINVYQNEKTLSVGYQDLKRIRGILQGNEFDLQMFEEYLQELKGSGKE